MNIPCKIITTSAEQTERLGAELAELLLSSDKLPKFIAMYGDLGVGKTAFTRGFTSFVSPKSAVRSPTFTLVNEYLGGICPVFHFDMYRITSEDDLYSIGFDDYPTRGGFCIAEWCENIGYALPEERINVTIIKNQPDDPESRLVEINLC